MNFQLLAALCLVLFCAGAQASLLRSYKENSDGIGLIVELTDTSDWDLDHNACAREECPRRCPLENHCDEYDKVLDGCRCCWICPRQQNEACSQRLTCDWRQNRLRCDAKTNLCQAIEIKRRGCMGPGRVSYEHGDVMQRACDQVCTCDNGGKACKKLCPQLLVSVPELFKQPYCVDARFIKHIDDCCGSWECFDNGTDIDMSKYIVQSSQAAHAEELRPVVKKKGGCLTQITPWSACSKDCGWGESTRLNSDNKGCVLVDESRKCMNRPCKSMGRTMKKRTQEKCQKTWRPKKASPLVIDGCTSVSPHRPRYCRSCPGQCCKPTTTKTHRVSFQCEDGSSVFKKVQAVRKCTCFPGACLQDMSSNVAASRQDILFG